MNQNKIAESNDTLKLFNYIFIRANIYTRSLKVR